MSAIGFVGLGNMGLPMATNLVRAGHDVRAYDPAPEAMNGAREAGMTVAADASGAISGAEFIVTMLPDGAIVLNVLAGIIASAGHGTVLVDCSTIDVASARRMHAMAGEAGLRPVDAPVSGGTAGAAAGTLTFMAGGDDDAVAAAAPLFEAMGSRYVHCGPGGSGQAAKLCNNLLLGVSMLGACEAFALAERLGLSAEAAFDVISTSSGACWSVNSYCPLPGVGPDSPADHAYRPGFAAALMLKDLTLARQAAEEAGQPVPMGEQARALFERFVDEGGAGRDFSAIIETLRPDGPA